MKDGMFVSELRPKNISKIIVERIVGSILIGELGPGDKLPSEEEFAARIGVGRSSVREAVKILEAFGIVEIRRADGIYVVDEFKGAMLTPFVLGIVMAGRSAADILDFKLRVQRLISDDLMELRSFGAVSSCLSMIETAACGQLDSDSLVSLLEEIERRLALSVQNPLVRELYIRTTQMSSGKVEKAVRIAHASGKSGEVCAVAVSILRALAIRDEEALDNALENEGKWLLASVI